VAVDGAHIVVQVPIDVLGNFELKDVGTAARKSDFLGDACHARDGGLRGLPPSIWGKLGPGVVQVGMWGDLVDPDGIRATVADFDVVGSCHGCEKGKNDGLSRHVVWW
jgi:hypothetical protein